MAEALALQKSPARTNLNVASMRSRNLELALCLALLGAQGALAQNAHVKPGETPKPAPAKAPPTEATALLLGDALHLSDFPDMAPRPELRTKLTLITGFIQNTPNDGQPGTEKTEVWLGYTKTTLYFVFICYDRHPGEIRSHLARRENILNDDNVSVLLDPFRTGARVCCSR